ncbi:MAG: hypothetical protein WCC69_11785 [Pirellulales bacterium]
MNLLDMIGAAHSGSVYSHSFADWGMRPPPPGDLIIVGGAPSGSYGGGSPQSSLRGGRGCYGPTGGRVGCSSLRGLGSPGSVPVQERPGIPNTAPGYSLRGLASPGSVPVEERPGIPNTMPGYSLRTLRALRQTNPNCPPTVCPECKGCHPIFYLGTAAAAVMILALVLK